MTGAELRARTIALVATVLTCSLIGPPLGALGVGLKGALMNIYEEGLSLMAVMLLFMVPFVAINPLAWIGAFSFGFHQCVVIGVVYGSFGYFFGTPRIWTVLIAIAKSFALGAYLHGAEFFLLNGVSEAGFVVPVNVAPVIMGSMFFACHAIAAVLSWLIVRSFRTRAAA